MKEISKRSFNKNSKALASTSEASVGPVNKEKLWLDVTKRMVTCIKDGGFYFETKETPPPFKDVMIGVFCRVAVVDKTGVNYEAGLQSYHYPGDNGESQCMQISHTELLSHVFVTITFRSNNNIIRLSPASEVKKHRSISSYPKKLDSNEETQLLNKLSEVIIDEKGTLELFNEQGETWGRSVMWIRNMSPLPSVLE